MFDWVLNTPVICHSLFARKNKAQWEFNPLNDSAELIQKPVNLLHSESVDRFLYDRSSGIQWVKHTPISSSKAIPSIVTFLLLTKISFNVIGYSKFAKFCNSWLNLILAPKRFYKVEQLAISKSVSLLITKASLSLQRGTHSQQNMRHL